MPLPHPLSFGCYAINSREYVVVRIRTVDGVTASCVGLSRGLPIDLVVLEAVGPHVLRRNALEIETIREGVRQGTRALGRSGIVTAALSLVDICLWDVKAQLAGMPLWLLLGGDPRVLPVLLVEGYSLPDEDDQQFADRLAERIESGYTAVKLEAASYSDPARVARRLMLIRDRVGYVPALVVDMAWSWESAVEGARAMRLWEPAQPAWIEDPMPRHLRSEMARLRTLSNQPLGVGDEASDIGELTALLADGLLDTVRVDALTIGGIGPARELTALALREGKVVSTHAHPEVHQHLAFAGPGHAYVEEFPVERGFDLTHALAEYPLDHPSTGFIRATTVPGTGVSLRDAQVARHAYRTGVEKG